MDKAARKMYKIKELADGVYGIDSTAVMSWLIVGKTSAMLIDTAYGFEDLRQVIRHITDLPVTVVNSHGHIDHSGGNFYFDTPICIHEADVEVYRRHNQPAFHRYMEKTLKIFQIIAFWRHVVPKDPERNDEKRASFNNWRFVKEGDRFDLGSLTAQIIEIPGHTQGSIAVHFPEKRLIVTTDGACSATWLFLPESTKLSTYIESLKKLEKLDYDSILTGHSDKFFTRGDLRKWLHVAEHPDLKNGRLGKERDYAPGVKPITCWATDDPRHKGPTVVLDPKKMDLEGC